MDPRQPYASQKNAPPGNPGMNNGANISSYSPHPLVFSFPPPPALEPSFNNVQCFNSESSLPTTQHANAFPSFCEATNVALEHGDVPVDIKNNMRVNEVTGMFQSSMKLNGNDGYSNKLKDAIGVSGLNTMEFTGLYPVLLTPSSFMHPACGTGSQPMYQQFGHNVQSHLSQLQSSVYSINMMSQRDPVVSNPPMAAIPPVCSIECPNPTTNAQLLDTTPEGCLPHIQGCQWSQSTSPNPPLFWGHYIPAEKPCGVYQHQNFGQQHSIIDESSVVTPTNVCQPCNFAGIVSATPEFIHPRKPDVPQWLMSPPVGDQDPNIISYAPVMYHNMRIPSVTGIAIPFMRPTKSSVPLKNGDAMGEISKVERKNQITVSPVTSYSVEPFDAKSEIVVPAKTSAFESQDNVDVYNNLICDALMTPADFCIPKVSDGMSKKDELLPPASSTSRHCDFRNSDKNLQYVTFGKSNEPITNVTMSRSLRLARLNNSASSVAGKQRILAQQQLTERQKSDRELTSSDFSLCTKPIGNHVDGDNVDIGVIHSYLLNAAKNLSVLTDALLKKSKSCHFCKKHFDHCKQLTHNHRNKHLHVNRTRKSFVPEKREENASGAAKEPVPDVFNQWPNIPPPPAPAVEGEVTCQDASCDGLGCSTDIALPLAAALFHSDHPDCCGNALDEDLSTPSTYPIGVFWDIENCAVPSGKSARAVVQRVRERFFTGHKEAEFMCVCDIIKENRNVIEELNNAQVDVVHINATAKNAADDKLRQSIRRFAHNHPAPATVVLITGDTNFTSEVSDLRHRHQYFVVLIHPSHASQSLKQAANTVISYEEMVADLPSVHASPRNMNESNQALVLVSNLPTNNDANAVRSRLHKLSENCGGKVIKLSMGTAILKFSSIDVANRAMKRIDGEDVFGHTIKASVLKDSPLRNFRNGLSNVPSPARNGFNNFPSPARNGGFRPKDMTNGTFGQAPYFSPFIKPAPVVVPPPPGHLFTTIANFSPMYPSYPTATHPTFCPVQSAYRPQPGYYAPAQPTPNISNPANFTVTHMTQPPQDFQPLVKTMEQLPCFGVKLTVSNIDAQLGINAIQDILLKEVSSYCQVLDMKVRPHNRFTVVCDVTVPCLQDASNVLQNLQRQKIGSKRVLVTLAQQNQGMEEIGFEQAAMLKRNSFSILKDAVELKMPLCRFLNLYETRFHHKLSVNELWQIHDVVVVQGHPGMQEVSLVSKIKDQRSLEQHLSSYPRSGRSSPDLNHAFLLPVCKAHFPTDKIRSSKINGNKLLKIDMGLREFSAKLHALLHSHNGIVQLEGFEFCYCAEYGAFPYPSDQDEGGVIVEHQASYVPGVQIITSQPHCLGVKAIVWAQPQSDIGSDSASDTSGASRWKSPNLIHFSREVVELLKERSYCCLPYEKFASAYQLHFGHPCRPSEYGFTRLSDLLTAIPHVLQIMGSLSNRVITLTHRAQVKRFTQEVVKILKTTPDRAILVAQMPELYNRAFNKVWRLRDYGVNVLADLLDDIPEGHICTTGEGDNIVLSLPLRERSAEEKERTGQFAREVIKILRNRPHYQMPFTEFVPAYHRQFGRQCKLSNYGFSKLIDLFEALPLYVEVIEKGTEKYIALTDTEHRKVLSMQISTILRAQMHPSFPLTSRQKKESTDISGPTLPLNCVPALFQQKYRFPLLPDELGCRGFEELMRKLSHAITVYTNDAGDKMIRLANRKPLRLLAARLLTLILDGTSDHLDVDQISTMYLERFKENLEPCEYGFMSVSDIVRKALPGAIKMDLDAPECVIHVKPLYIEARAIKSILLNHNGTMTLGEFNFAYLTTFHRPVDCEKLGYSSFEGLLRGLGNIIMVKGFGSKRTLSLRDHIHCGAVDSLHKEHSYGNALLGSASMDDLQSLDACQPQSSKWVPKVPPCMMPFWNITEKKKGFPMSASTGNFRTGRSPENWRAAEPIATMRHHSGNTNPKLLGKSFSSDVSPKVACSFTVGNDASTSKAHSMAKENGHGNFSYTVITLPNGSTPITSTSSCSTSSSLRSSAETSCDTYSSDTDSYTASSQSDIGCDIHEMSSVPCSPPPTARVNGGAHPGSVQLLASQHPSSDPVSPQRIQLAASFPTLTHS